MEREKFAWMMVRSLGVACLLVAAFLLYQFFITLTVSSILWRLAVDEEGFLSLMNIPWSPLLNALFWLAMSLCFLKFGGKAQQLILPSSERN